MSNIDISVFSPVCEEFKKLDKINHLLFTISYEKPSKECNISMNEARILLGLKHKEIPSDKTSKMVVLKRELRVLKRELEGA